MKVKSGGLLAEKAVERFDPEGLRAAMCERLKGSGDRGTRQGAGDVREAERRRGNLSRGIEEAGREH